MPQLTGSSVAGGSRTPHFSPTGRPPGSMARRKTYNSLVLLLMSQNGAVLQSNHLSPISRCAQTLKNLNTVQYIRWNIKREGICEIYNVRPLAISAEEGSHSNAPGSIKIPQKCYSSSKRRVCNMSCRSHASLQSVPQIINPNVTQYVFFIITLNQVTNWQVHIEIWHHSTYFFCGPLMFLSLERFRMLEGFLHQELFVRWFLGFFTDVFCSSLYFW